MPESRRSTPKVYPIVKKCPCGQTCPPGYRYCYKCQGRIGKEMVQSGYLTPAPLRGTYRDGSAREDRGETKSRDVT